MDEPDWALWCCMVSVQLLTVPSHPESWDVQVPGYEPHHTLCAVGYRNWPCLKHASLMGCQAWGGSFDPESYLLQLLAQLYLACWSP